MARRAKRQQPEMYAYPLEVSEEETAEMYVLALKTPEEAAAILNAPESDESERTVRNSPWWAEWCRRHPA